jgi:hypothetical protein
MDHFDAKIPLEALNTLLEIGNELGFDPTASDEAEVFFLAKISEFSADHKNISDWLREEVPHFFICVGVFPRWIQNPAWPFTSDGPMTFVGQIDISSGLFHDEASFYVFIERKTGATKTVVQVS